MLGGTETAVHDVVRTPLWPALAVGGAALVAVGSAVASLVWADAPLVPLAIAGYVIGCIAAVALASTHRALENRVRPNPQFRLQPALGLSVRVSMIAGVAGGLVCAFQLATELAKP